MFFTFNHEFVTFLIKFQNQKSKLRKKVQKRNSKKKA